MKKTLYILSTLAVMLVVSRFVIRIVDATVQIDNDIGMLVLLLLLVNAVIGWIGWRLCRAHGKKTDANSDEAVLPTARSKTE